MSLKVNDLKRALGCHRPPSRVWVSRDGVRRRPWAASAARLPTSNAVVDGAAGGMPLLRNCGTVAESMAWAKHGVARAKALGLEDLVTMWSSRRTTISSICSGIMAPELALCMAARGAGSEGKPLWAAENDRQKRSSLA